METQKVCRTLDGLQKAIKKGENCCLKYTSKAISGSGGYIIYLVSGTNLIVSDNTYDEIKDYLVQA